MTGSPFAQPGSGVRFDWGLAGAVELGRACAVLAVVDVLSFTTSVTVAVERGMRVHPFPWDSTLAEYARRTGAVVAAGRADASEEHPWSLSPAALAGAPIAADLVLPSPNGSAICAAAGATGIPVVAACLRNVSAVGAWLLDRGYGLLDAPIGVVASGERWPDHTLRPCVEDLLGAACLIDRLVTAPGGLSVEASVALATLGSLPDAAAAIHGCVSGRELIERGFEQDVRLAVERDVSHIVPVLLAGVFQPPITDRRR